MTTKNYFTELNQINVNDKLDKKPGGGGKEFSYLSWAYAWAEIKKQDSNANYTIHENAEGHPFWVSQFGIDVKVSVTMFGVTHTMRLPLLDGGNRVIKSEAYQYEAKVWKFNPATKQKEQTIEIKTVAAADMTDINKGIMRCLVKAIALHGLGLYIYLGEDMPENIKLAEQKQIDFLVKNGYDKETVEAMAWSKANHIIGEILAERKLEKEKTKIDGAVNTVEEVKEKLNKA